MADRSPSSDPLAARRTSPYSLREKLARIAWGFVQATVFRCSFHNWYALRRTLLRAFGAKLHDSANLRRTVLIECPWNLSIGAESSIGDRAILYCLGPVTIGARVTVSQGAHLCAGSHDSRRASMPLVRSPIDIEDDVWIAADAFVGPKVRVKQGAVLGACGVALADLEPWTIYLGNPAVRVRTREFDGRPPVAGA
ncbi:MAG: putative colanic acid biosynthesis acetyltransferase [bacterium]|jgi:putative colanic acid biosynthesis acetyltransferase WcaF